MAMPERSDRDAAGEIEITLAVLADQVTPLPSHRPEPAARIDGHECGDGHWRSPRTEKGGPTDRPERAIPGRRRERQLSLRGHRIIVVNTGVRPAQRENTTDAMKGILAIGAIRKYPAGIRRLRRAPISGAASSASRPTMQQG